MHLPKLSRFVVYLLPFSMASVAHATHKDIVLFADQAPIIDGIDNEQSWQKAQWHAMSYLMDGVKPDSPKDFSGQFRMLWDESYLYLQAKIDDDVLLDIHPDPLDSYWDDDCLEIFIDEDASGGKHQFTHNAFAYHVALDNQVVDFGPNKQPNLYNEHVKSAWQRDANAPHTITWEVAIKVFDDTYQDDKKNTPVVLRKGKQLGFMLAYCDNDKSEGRETFMGNVDFPAQNGSKNLGYIDASVFGKIVLQTKK